MKNLITIVTLLFTASAMAEMPKYLEGATVTVTLKNGKSYSYESKEMAVVPRNNLDINAAKIAFNGKIVKALKEEKIVPNKKNRIYLLGGYGSTGSLETSTNGSTYETKQKQGLVGGIGYQYKFSNEYNFGVQLQTTGTTSLSVGKDF